VRRLNWIIFGLLTVVLALGWWYLDWGKYGADPGLIRDLVLTHKYWTPVVFILIQLIAEIFLVPGSPFTIAGGLLFGTLMGSVYSMLANTLSSMIIFLVLRYAGKSGITRYLHERFKLVKRFNIMLKEDGFRQVLLMRLIPVTPANLINVSFAFTKVPTRDYFWATVIGNLPGTILLSYIGSFLYAREVPHLLFVVVVAGVVSALLYYKSHLFKKFLRM